MVQYERHIRTAHSGLSIHAFLTSNFQARFNPFGIRVQDFDHRSLKNVTAVKEYVAHLERFFDTDQMKKHLKFVLFFSMRIKTNQNTFLTTGT